MTSLEFGPHGRTGSDSNVSIGTPAQRADMGGDIPMPDVKVGADGVLGDSKGLLGGPHSAFARVHDGEWHRPRLQYAGSATSATAR